MCACVCVCVCVVLVHVCVYLRAQVLTCVCVCVRTCVCTAHVFELCIATHVISLPTNECHNKHYTFRNSSTGQFELNMCWNTVMLCAGGYGLHLLHSLFIEECCSTSARGLAYTGSIDNSMTITAWLKSECRRGVTTVQHNMPYVCTDTRLHKNKGLFCNPIYSTQVAAFFSVKWFIT